MERGRDEGRVSTGTDWGLKPDLDRLPPLPLRLLILSLRSGQPSQNSDPQLHRTNQCVWLKCKSLTMNWECSNLLLAHGPYDLTSMIYTLV